MKLKEIEKIQWMKKAFFFPKDILNFNAIYVRFSFFFLFLYRKSREILSLPIYIGDRWRFTVSDACHRSPCNSKATIKIG